MYSAGIVTKKDDGYKLLYCEDYILTSIYKDSNADYSFKLSEVKHIGMNNEGVISYMDIDENLVSLVERLNTIYTYVAGTYLNYEDVGRKLTEMKDLIILKNLLFIFKMKCETHTVHETYLVFYKSERIA